MSVPSFPDPWVDPRRLEGDHGGQAVTWLIKNADERDGKDFVAKVVRDLNPARRAKFRQEVEACKLLEGHPNVTKVVAVGETTKHGTPFFVMPY